MTQQQNKQGGGGCKKIFAIGCGCLVVLAILAGVAAFIFKDEIGGIVEEIGDALKETLEIREKVMDEYEADEVNVAVSTSSGQATLLKVSLKGTPYADLQGEEQVEKAREIASFAKNILKEATDYGAIEIAFQTVRGGVATWSEKHTFKIEDL